MKSQTETTQLVIGMSHREMVDIMQSAGIFCSPDRFCRILQEAQRRALAERALERMAENAEELRLDDVEPESEKD
ncbi:hypothetical protein BGLT_02230 [Caballeronia glathei]|uniref:CopG family transcriptional regulator n=1 Tax=Caballeronia glathei TaxID=60547 RepID=A0A069PP04_9BURK|nr:hypothetical protein [Caballeronia glathei]KDR41599.1 hypothetical protein BG61_16890 [Caballeronia glathei]CDY79449.1 hypothetical protein BGLT_02230 [Caballeronia glathei]